MATIQFESDYVTGAKIKVIGIGGAGSNAVDNLLEAGLQGVEFYVLNTDVQALDRSKSQNKMQIGKDITHGRGAGSDPAVGREAAETASEEIKKILMGADMVFITAGLGGGTGTGAAPVVARLANELGILTVAVVTLPFEFEGRRRAANAHQGLEELRKYVDACTVVNNHRLFKVVDAKTPIPEALKVANGVLTMAVASVSEVINVPGTINVEFSDVRNIMKQTGGAVIGFGIGKGEQRAIEAVKKARENQLLDCVEIKGAKGILVCFTGGKDLTLQEVGDACDLIYKEADPDANIILGVVVNENMMDEVRVTIIATGLDKATESSMFSGIAASPYSFSPQPFVTPPAKETTPSQPSSKVSAPTSSESSASPTSSQETSVASSGSVSAEERSAQPSIRFVPDEELDKKTEPAAGNRSGSAAAPEPSDPLAVPAYLRHGLRQDRL
jgi:cell division protein FtsZ